MPEPTFQIYTFLRAEDAERLGGIPPQAVVGLVDSRVFTDGAVPLTPETFRPNSVFRAFLHEVLSRSVFQVQGMRAQAHRIGEGWVYITDGRTPDPTGEVPAHDIVGGVQTADGTLVPGSYWANPAHRIVSERGLFQLPGELHSILVEAMRALPPVATDGE